MKRDAQVAIAVPVRMAVWNWIDLYPEEFNDAICSHRRLDGAPERVFDALYERDDGGNNKTNIWPALAALMSISPDRIKTEYETNTVGLSKNNRKVSSTEALLLELLLLSPHIFRSAISLTSLSAL